MHEIDRTPFRVWLHCLTPIGHLFLSPSVPAGSKGKLCHIDHRCTNLYKCYLFYPQDVLKVWILEVKRDRYWMEGNTIKCLSRPLLLYFIDFTGLQFYLKGRVKYYSILLVIMLQCDRWSGWDEVLVELLGWFHVNGWSFLLACVYVCPSLDKQPAQSHPIPL